MDVAFFKVSNGDTKERKDVGSSPAIKFNMKAVLDRLKVEGNGNARVLIHIQNITGYRLTRMDFDGSVEHGEDLVELIIFNDGVWSCTAC